MNIFFLILVYLLIGLFVASKAKKADFLSIDSGFMLFLAMVWWPGIIIAFCLEKTVLKFFDWLNNKI